MDSSAIRTEKKYNVTVQVVEPSELAPSKKGGGEGSSVVVYKGSGDSVAEAIREIVEMFCKVFGKPIGHIVSLLCQMVYPIYLCSLTLRNIGDFMTSQIMPETPIEVIHIVFMAF